MRQLLDAATIPTPTSPIFAHTPKETTQVCSALKALGIKVGDKVLVSGAEVRWWWGDGSGLMGGRGG